MSRKQTHHQREDGKPWLSPIPQSSFTYEDYLNAPEDKRYELLDGRVGSDPCPRRNVTRAFSILLGSKNCFQFAYENSLGAGLSRAFWTWCCLMWDVVQPDLLFRLQ